MKYDMQLCVLRGHSGLEVMRWSSVFLRLEKHTHKHLKEQFDSFTDRAIEYDIRLSSIRAIK